MGLFAEKTKKQETLFFSSRDVSFYDLLGKQVNDLDSSLTHFVSAIPSLHILRTVVEVPKNIAPELLEERLIESAYTQLSLSFEDEYVMQFQKRRNSYDVNRDEYDLFLLPHNVIKERLSPFVEQHTCVDCVIPYSFIPQILYKRGFLAPKGGQIFVYIGDDDAFFLLFDEGDVIYSKSLEHKVGNLHEIFNAQSGLDLTHEEFVSYFSGEFSHEENYKELFEYLYRVLYNEIDEAISFVRRMHPEVHIDLLYVDSSIEMNTEFYRYLEEMTTLVCKPAHSISIGFDVKKGKNLIALAILYEKALSEGENLPNFTIYKRPLPILKRDSGKMVALSAIALIASLAYPAFELFHGIKLEQEIQKYAQAKMLSEQKERHYRSEIGKLEAQKQKLEEAIAGHEQEYERYTKALNEIYQWQRAYVLKSRVLSDFLNASAKYDIALREVNITHKAGIVTLESFANALPQRAFSAFLRQLGESGLYHEASTKEIRKKDGRHQSYIKAIIR